MRMKPRIILQIGVLAILGPLSNGVVRADRQLLEIFPDDVGAIWLVDHPQRALPPTTIEPLLKTLAPNAHAADKLFKAVRGMPGGFAVGYVPPPTKKKRPVVLVAAKLSVPAKLDGWLETSLLPAVEAMLYSGTGRSLKLDKTKNATRIITQPGDKTVFALAVKDKIAFGSNKPQLALEWLRGDLPKKRWTGMPGVRKMLKQLPKQSTMRVLFNPKPWLERLPKPKPNSLEELAFKVLAPEEIQGGSVDFSWKRTSLKVLVSVALSEECQGPGRLLTKATSSTRCLGLFPNDFVALGRLGWTNAGSVAEHLYALSDRFDETISAEYREDLASFREKTGIGWNTEILGHLVHEIVMGIRLDFSQPNPIGWAAVLPLDDPGTFSLALEKLISHFELTFEDASLGNLSIRTAVGTFPFSYAIAQDFLVVADNPETVADIAVKAGEKPHDEPHNTNMKACHEALGTSNHLAFMLDIEQLREKAPMLSMVLGPKWAQLLSEGSVGMVLRAEDRMAQLEFQWSLVSAGRKRRVVGDSDAQTEPDAIATLITTTVETLVRARLQAKRMVSMHTQRTLGQSLYIYANKHNGAFPESLEDLLRALPETVKLDMLVSPYDGEGPKTIADVDHDCYLLYRPGLTVHSAPTEVLLAERKLHGDGANFLFVDGHVEFIKDPLASELLERIEAGEQVIQKQ